MAGHTHTHLHADELVVDVLSDFSSVELLYDVSYMCIKHIHFPAF